MKDRTTWAPAVAIAAGLCGAVQPKINAVLGARVGSALIASLVNFGGAFVMVVLALAVRRSTRERLLRIPSWPVPKWTLCAGLGGAVVVLAGAASVETIGVAVFAVAFFAGQVIFGLIVDRLGIAPGGRRPVTPARLQAVALAVVAVVVSQVGRPVGELAPLLVAFVVLAGATFAFQASFNGRITAATGDPLAATAVNVTVGSLALVAVIGLLGLTGSLGSIDWPAEPWLYSGGLLGVTVVLSLAFAAAALGVLRTTVTMLGAQMVAAIVVDSVLLREPPTAGVIGGAVLIVVAVALVGRTALTVPADPIDQ